MNIKILASLLFVAFSAYLAGATVTPGGPIAITTPGQTVQFTTSAQSASWNISGLGTLTQSGLYTAPSSFPNNIFYTLVQITLIDLADRSSANVYLQLPLQVQPSIRSLAAIMTDGSTVPIAVGAGLMLSQMGGAWTLAVVPQYWPYIFSSHKMAYSAGVGWTSPTTGWESFAGSPVIDVTSAQVFRNGIKQAYGTDYSISYTSDKVPALTGKLLVIPLKRVGAAFTPDLTAWDANDAVEADAILTH